MGLPGDKFSTAKLLNQADEQYFVNSGSAVNITSATKTILKNSDGVLKKIIVNSHTSGTFKLMDGSATGTLAAIGGTYTPAAGSSVIVLEAEFQRGITILTAGTVDFTALFK